jgi:predicted transcriptional regulator
MAHWLNKVNFGDLRTQVEADEDYAAFLRGMAARLEPLVKRMPRSEQQELEDIIERMRDEAEDSPDIETTDAMLADLYDFADGAGPAPGTRLLWVEMSPS